MDYDQKMTTIDSSVLLVEDDYASGVLIKKLCERKNIHLKIATSGKQALEILEQESFKIILMDVQMPDMSGYKAVEIIRHREKSLHRHTPIVAITALVLAGNRQKCIDAGMDDYLEKPINVEQFYFLLARYISG